MVHLHVVEVLQVVLLHVVEVLHAVALGSGVGVRQAEVGAEDVAGVNLQGRIIVIVKMKDLKRR